VIGGFPAGVTRRRSPPVTAPAESLLRSFADRQACSAKIAAFAAVFAEGAAGVGGFRLVPLAIGGFAAPGSAPDPSVSCLWSASFRLHYRGMDGLALERGAECG
jgi:hypothetical protein